MLYNVCFSFLSLILSCHQPKITYATTKRPTAEMGMTHGHDVNFALRAIQVYVTLGQSPFPWNAIFLYIKLTLLYSFFKAIFQSTYIRVARIFLLLPWCFCQGQGLGQAVTSRLCKISFCDDAADTAGMAVCMNICKNSSSSKQHRQSVIPHPFLS